MSCITPWYYSFFLVLCVLWKRESSPLCKLSWCSRWNSRWIILCPLTPTSWNSCLFYPLWRVANRELVTCKYFCVKKMKWKIYKCFFWLRNTMKKSLSYERPHELRKFVNLCLRTFVYGFLHTALLKAFSWIWPMSSFLIAKSILLFSDVFISFL